MEAAALQLKGITKRFGAFTALDHVDLTLERGEILGILGENGAGKSTLMNIVRGLSAPDEGELRIEGQPVRLRSANDARALSIGMVHQHFLLVPSFTVADNLALGSGLTGVALSSVRETVLETAKSVVSRLNWTLPFEEVVSSLPVGVRQRIEIVRTLLSDPRIILFDEPTAVLAPAEINDFLRVMAALKAEGRSLVFVTHKLKEVTAICDRVVVLRRGRVVEAVRTADSSEADLARRMVGEATAEAAEISEVIPNPVQDSDAIGGASVLSLRGLSTSPFGHGVTLQSIDLDLQAGEILGIAGVDGNGQTELVDVLSGLRPWSDGTVEVCGTGMQRLVPADRARVGLAVIPPDRQREGLALDMTIMENLVSDSLRSGPMRSGPFLRNAVIKKLAAGMAEKFDIRTSNILLPARSLSGGNQQKIVIARALRQEPTIVVAASPTRGLDVHATAYVHSRLRERRDAGAGILLISTELDEIIKMSDRIAVLYEGRIMGIVSPTAARETIGLMMGGRVANA